MKASDGKFQREKLLGRPKYCFGDIIKIDLKGLGRDH
jgi:hypothetical protein